MNKFVVNTLIISVLSLFSAVSQATLITNLTQAELAAKDYVNAEDQLTADLQGINYITYQGYDWAWVSPVNIEEFAGNVLYAPEVQGNWQFADKGLLNILKTELTLADFTNDEGQYIHAAQYFNSMFDHIDEINFISGYVGSEWTEPGAFYESFFGGFETFYVRNSFAVQSAPIPSTIPEPLTVLLFVCSLIILAGKLRKSH
jgi:hypothetical protein